jgi:hypothetical protein
MARRFARHHLKSISLPGGIIRDEPLSWREVAAARDMIHGPVAVDFGEPIS